MKENEIGLSVRQIIAKKLSPPGKSWTTDDVTPEKYLVQDLGADSLDGVEITMEYEKQFGIEISGLEEESILTVQDSIDIVNRKINEKTL